MSDGKRGDALEFDVARYFQAQGYVVRRGITLSVAAGTAEATDIDLFALRYVPPLSEHRLIADCKDRKRPRPFERILWTAGLSTFARANRAIVVSPKAPWQAREFAAQGAIEVLGADIVSEFLNTVDREGWRFGDSDPGLHQRKQSAARTATASEKEFLKHLQREEARLRQLLVIGNPITNLNRVIRALTRFGANAPVGEPSLPMRAFCAEALCVAGIMLVRFASESKWTPEHDWTENARKRLTYGDVSPSKARQLARIALDSEFYDGLPEPEYAEELIELIRSLIAKPHIAAITPLALDMLLFGQGLGLLPREALEYQLGADTQLALQSARRVISGLSYATRIPATLLPVTNNNYVVHGIPSREPLSSASRVDDEPPARAPDPELSILPLVTTSDRSAGSDEDVADPNAKAPEELTSRTSRAPIVPPHEGSNPSTESAEPAERTDMLRHQHGPEGS